ncbi:MAG: hypothetical protein M3217_02285 [Actinomycetota bacterium]|nr:hypothetical protein [Actinomycetota bacterium]
MRIPRPTIVDSSLTFRRAGGPNRHTNISGEGPFTGIALAPLADDLGEGEDLLVVLGQFKGCTYGCTEPRSVNYTAPFRDRVKLPPGTYRVWFMAGESGGRVQVQFLRGRKGKLVVAPRHPIDFEAAVPSAVSTSSDFAISAGHDYALMGEGLRFSVLDVVVTDNGSSSSMGTCLYEKQADTPEESRFQPGCPEGAGAGRQVYPVAPEARRFYFQDYEFIYDPATWAFGAWHQSSIAVESVVHGAVFLTV